jgi:predicted nucleic acid-binding protein
VTARAEPERIIVDASVVVKWFVPEPGHEEARQLLFAARDRDLDLHAPDLMLAEVANVFFSKVRANGSRLGEDDVLEAVRALRDLRITLHQHGGLVESALSLALSTGATVYDTLYAALALRLAGELVTADKQLLRRLSSSGWEGRARLLQLDGDEPPGRRLAGGATRRPPRITRRARRLSD